MNELVPSTSTTISQQTMNLINPSKTKILIVDDDRTILKVLRKVLERNDYLVVEACNGNEALKILRKNAINLVVSDVYMPEVTGIDLLNEIKTLDLRIPVIIITGKASVDAAVECMKIGAFDYLSKPLSLERIEDSVANALEHAHIANLNSDLVSITSFKDDSSTFLDYKNIRKTGRREYGSCIQSRKNGWG